MKGARNNLAGLAGEGAVLRHYLQDGYDLLVERFRGTFGEIDLILAKGSSVIFIEVKKSRNFDAALARVSPAQIRRIMTTAEEYLANAPNGLSSDMRFDVAMVNSVGEVAVLENAFT